MKTGAWCLLVAALPLVSCITPEQARELQRVADEQLTPQLPGVAVGDPAAIVNTVIALATMGGIFFGGRKAVQVIGNRAVQKQGQDQ